MSHSLRSIRRRVAIDLVCSRGFVEHGSLYLRESGQQLHAIDFQTSSSSKEFTINLGFHYTFLPSFSTLTPKRLDSFRIVDFWIMTRLGKVIEGIEQDKWWRYDIPGNRLEEDIRYTCGQAILALDTASREWQDPLLFSRTIPPSAIREAIAEYSDETSIFDMDKPFRILIPRWIADTFNLSFMLAASSVRNGDYELAIEYAEAGLSDDLPTTMRNALLEIRERAVSQDV